MRIKAYLKRATQLDLFDKNENVIEGQPLFYKSQISGKMQGPWYTTSASNSVGYYELLVKLSIGMVYVLNFHAPKENDIAIELEMLNTTMYDIKRDHKNLFNGRPYFVKNKKLQGPYFLNETTDPYHLKKILDNNQMFSINTNQQIKLITKQKAAV